MKKMGRPPKYETALELKQAVDRYIAENEKICFTAMSKSLGFTDRHAFTRQKDRGPEFADVVAHTQIQTLINNYGEDRIKKVCKQLWPEQARKEQQK